MAKREIRVSGFGGQGVILTAHIIGKAASIFAAQNATMTQSFGPEARGGACSAQLVISDKEILYPYVKNIDILIAMSQEAYEKFEPELKDNGLLLIESDLVKLRNPRRNIKIMGIPATSFAEELGRKIVLNIVMLGFFTAITTVVSVEAMREALKDSIPKGTEEINMKAFEKGYEYGKSLMESAKH